MTILLNMIREKREVFFPGQIVTSTIVFNNQSIIKVKLENGLEGIIHTGDFDINNPDDL